MNIKLGGRGRLSTFVSGVFLLVLIMVLHNYVKVIPMAVLVGIMIIVCIETLNFESLRNIHKMPRKDALIMLITMGVVIMTHDLAKGVLVGLLISAVAFAWAIDKVINKYDQLGKVVYIVGMDRESLKIM